METECNAFSFEFQPQQAVEALAHVDRLGTEKHPHGGRQAEHQRTSDRLKEAGAGCVASVAHVESNWPTIVLAVKHTISIDNCQS